MSHGNGLPNEDDICRVYISPRTKAAHVSCIGIEVDSVYSGEYASVDDLPLWVQHKLALLMMTGLTTPTAMIHGVGRRIDADVFWVFREGC